MSEQPALRGGRWDDGALIIRVRVQTRARHAGLGEIENGELRLRLNAPPVDGRANEEARRLLARAFGVSPTRVELVAGPTGRQKTFRITSPAKIPDALR